MDTAREHIQLKEEIFKEVRRLIDTKVNNGPTTLNSHACINGSQDLAFVALKADVEHLKSNVEQLKVIVNELSTSLIKMDAIKIETNNNRLNGELNSIIDAIHKVEDRVEVLEKPKPVVQQPSIQQLQPAVTQVQQPVSAPFQQQQFPQFLAGGQTTNMNNPTLPFNATTH